jgi:hypothetical protein
MKTSIPNLFHKFAVVTALSATAFLATNQAHATNYAGNGNTGFGGSIGNGTLSVTDDGTNITFTIVPSGGNIGGNDLAVYIDTGVGGFTSTTNFNDQTDGGHISLSGYNGSSQQSVLTFTNGFKPSYGISFSDSYTSLFQLANGGNGSFTYITGTGTTPHVLTISASQIGLTPGVPATIRIFGSLISGTAYRSTEAIAGNDYGAFGQGWVPFTQTAYGTYSFAAPATPTYPVTFQVDMSVQIANGSFNPVNGDTVLVAGTFLTNALVPFQLTPSVGNTNIYTGTYQDGDPIGTAEKFQFQYDSVSGNTNIMENFDKRPFTLQSGGQTLPLVYFNNLAPSSGVPVHNLTFQIDLKPQIGLGNFVQGTDAIEVFGTFQNPATWSISSGLVLTNNPNGANTNLYTGTYPDGNYTGSFEEYKFVIAKGGAGSGTYNYESINNRQFFTPTNDLTFTLAYFNNVSSVYSIPVTFQVDMTVPLAAGQFNPANGDTCGAAGTFQTNQWTVGANGFLLTNNPTAANSNIYSGTYIDLNTPGTAEQYKFVINSGGTTTYESINNRTFLLNSSARTNPLVLWNNEDPNQVILTPTTVTFTVNMTNAVDVFGNPFNPATDVVVVNGNFMNPPWPNFWSDALLGGFDYVQNVLQNGGTNLLYTGTFTVAAGSSLQVQYKYGIIHNFTGTSNTNADNEANFGLNHTRYIRTVGNYNFPVDIFGIQQTNLAAATEPAFGNLAIGKPTAGQLPISWLGLPGVHLQFTTNLLSTNWVNLNATSGTSATNWPTGGGNGFFRLIQP